MVDSTSASWMCSGSRPTWSCSTRRAAASGASPYCIAAHGRRHSAVPSRGAVPRTRRTALSSQTTISTDSSVRPDRVSSYMPQRLVLYLHWVVFWLSRLSLRSHGSRVQDRQRQSIDGKTQRRVDDVMHSRPRGHQQASLQPWTQPPDRETLTDGVNRQRG